MDIQNGTADYLKQHHVDLIDRQLQLKARPLQFLNKTLLKISAGQDVLAKDVRNRFKNETIRLKNFSRLVELASPIKTLQRGFSIVRLSDGTLLRSIKQAKINDEVNMELSDGKVQSVVKKIMKEA